MTLSETNSSTHSVRSGHILNPASDVHHRRDTDLLEPGNHSEESLAYYGKGVVLLKYGGELIDGQHGGLCTF